MEARWLLLKEISEYLGVRRETILKWLTNRNLSGHQVGKLWKFKASGVDAWVKAGKDSIK
mgnify:FL=1